jgi:hypothetical protein
VVIRGKATRALPRFQIRSNARKQKEKQKKIRPPTQSSNHLRKQLKKLAIPCDGKRDLDFGGVVSNSSYCASNIP